MTSPDIGGRPQEAYGDAAHAFRADVRATQDRSGMVVGVPTSAGSVPESLAVFTLPTPKPDASGVLCVGDSAPRVTLDQLTPQSSTNEITTTTRDDVLVFGTPLTYNSQRLENAGTWAGWREALDDEERTDRIFGILADDGTMFWSETRDGSHEDLSRALGKEEDSGVLFYLKFPRSEDLDGDIFILGFKENKDALGSVINVGNYLVENIGKDEERVIIHQLIVDNDGNKWYEYYDTVAQYAADNMSGEEQLDTISDTDESVVAAHASAKNFGPGAAHRDDPAFGDHANNGEYHHEVLGLQPCVSASEKRVTYDLPGGEQVIAELVHADVGITIEGESEFRQIEVTRITPDGKSPPRTNFWRSYRDLSHLEDAERYPTKFFTPENFPGRVVEVATGDGGLVDGMKKRGIDAHGVDIWLSPRQREKDYFHFGFAENTGLPDAWTDDVFLHYLLYPYYVKDSIGGNPTATEKQIMTESARILRPGGHLFVLPFWEGERAHYEAMAKGTPLNVQDLDKGGINNPNLTRRPLIFQKAT